MLSRTITPRRRGRRPLTAVAIVTVVVALLATAGAVLAVHDEDFQLDANMFASSTTAIGGKTQTVDWDSLFDPTDPPGAPPAGSVPGAAPKDPLPVGFDSAGFDFDFNVNANGSFNTSDTSTFSTGSKDTLPITPGWQCGYSANVNSKTDVMNSYATSFTADGTGGAEAGDEILYFALERNANTGTGNVGFWFLQDTVACETVPGGPNVPFTGDHKDGDVLVVSEFTNGGAVTTIQAYKWEDPDPDDADPGFLNPNAVAGGDNLDCDGSTGDDTICANVNTATINNIPWLTSNKQDGVGHSLRSTEFFEAGLNLTAEGLGGKCFNTFIADTRSSTSLTATIFDFSLGTLGQCESGIVTTPQDGAGGDLDTTSIGTAARVTVRDHADITVSGQDEFGGTVKFFLCGPLGAASTSNCQTGGVQIGDPATGEPVTGTGGTASVNSDNVVLTAAGRYCWRAEYSGDGDVPASVDPDDDENVSECFIITPVTPTLTTSAGADVVLGNAIEDTATLSGTAKQPGTDGLGDGSIGASAATQANAGGTITFSLVGPGDCATVPTGFVDIDVPVDGDSDADTEYTASFTPGAIGEYTWIAEYDGDSPNTNGAGPTGCPDANEAVIVTGTSLLTTVQDWLPNDTATITGDTNLNGTVTFQLYTGNNCGVTSGAAVAGQLYTVDLVDEPSPATASTSNADSFLEADSGTYSWKVTYVDTLLEDPAPSCETTTITIDDTP